MIGKNKITPLNNDQGMRVEESLLYYRLTIRKNQPGLEQLQQWSIETMTEREAIDTSDSWIKEVPE